MTIAKQPHSTNNEKQAASIDGHYFKD